jgi:hypothetical protein
MGLSSGVFSWYHIMACWNRERDSGRSVVSIGDKISVVKCL